MFQSFFIKFDSDYPGQTPRPSSCHCVKLKGITRNHLMLIDQAIEECRRYTCTLPEQAKKRLAIAKLQVPLFFWPLLIRVWLICYYVHMYHRFQVYATLKEWIFLFIQEGQRSGQKYLVNDVLMCFYCVMVAHDLSTYFVRQVLPLVRRRVVDPMAHLNVQRRCTLISTYHQFFFVYIE